MKDRLRGWLTQLLRRRSWAELAFALLGLPIGVIGFSFTCVSLAASTFLLITFIGLPLLAVTALFSRRLGSAVRRIGNRLIGAGVAPPEAFRPDPGVLGWIGSGMKDGPAWRSRLYLLLKLPVGIVEFTVATIVYVYGLGGVSYGIWQPFLPCNTSDDGRCHRGIGVAANYYIDTPGRIVWFSFACLGVLLLAPWAVRAVISVDRLLIRLLLGPTSGADRVAELERTRAAAVEDSAAMLRRIERDLHDGAQARLVALAMNVGLAREKLAEGGDPAEAGALLDSAHSTAKQAIAELRNLARGIHPPVLDAGLDAALATLAAHSAVPVQLSTSITDRPDPAIETMAYFCAAELLTNVAKHSGASTARVDARTAGGRLIVAVSDDGHGGARRGDGDAVGRGTGTGLAGLAERIATVDGRLIVDSPDGGPTTVTVDMPLRAGGRA